MFGGIKKKLSGVRGQIQVKSISDRSKDELITYFIKAFRKKSEVSKNKKTTSYSENIVSSASVTFNTLCKSYVCNSELGGTTEIKNTTAGKCPVRTSLSKPYFPSSYLSCYPRYGSPGCKITFKLRKCGMPKYTLTNKLCTT